ncbi:MAG TPA: GrpB family protein [Blastocatellia bacterium]|nr:GrpB family protein [Blastocatellia bacterium]
MVVAIGQYIETHPSYRDYDEQAPVVAQALIELITEANSRLRVEHIGSSSVPGCGGKGYIDLMVLYPDGALDAANQALADLGFQRQGSRDPFPEDRPMRIGSVLHNGLRYLIHAHVIAESSLEVEVMLGFRDRLRSDHSLIRAYEAEKRRILAEGVQDGVDYAERKSDFVQATLRLRLDSSSGCGG